MKVVHQATIMWSATKGKDGCREDRRLGRGGGVESNLPSRRGWTRSYFNFNSGGCNFILRPTLLILERPPPPPDNYCTVP